MIQSFLCHQTVWINFTSDIILSRCFDFYMFMKFQMNGITSLHGINKRHQETNYCAFDDNRKLRATKVSISFMLKLLHSLFLRWWLSNFKCCAKSNKSEKYHDCRRTKWLPQWLLDELQDCNSKFIRRHVEVLWLVIHSTRKI